MPEAKRTAKDVQADFNNLAFRCGHLQHDICKKHKDLEVMNETLETLQREYTELKKSEDDAVAAAAKAAQPELASEAAPVPASA